MARRKKKERDAPERADESEWEDWRALREELGKRLGGRDAMGVSDADVAVAANEAVRKRPRR